MNLKTIGISLAILLVSGALSYLCTTALKGALSPEGKEQSENIILPVTKNDSFTESPVAVLPSEIDSNEDSAKKEEGQNINPPSSRTESPNSKTATIQQAPQDKVEKQETLDEAISASQAPSSVNNLIQYVSTPIRRQDNNVAENISYSFSVSVNQEYAAQCKIELINESTSTVISSSNGSFWGVRAVKSGQYTLRISTGGSYQERIVTGFALLPRQTGLYIIQQVNSLNPDKQFLWHFAKNIQITCSSNENIDSSMYPRTINELSNIQALGLKAQSVSNIQYNQYNLITSMHVVLCSI